MESGILDAKPDYIRNIYEDESEKVGTYTALSLSSSFQSTGQWNGHFSNIRQALALQKMTTDDTQAKGSVWVPLQSCESASQWVL